jgi:PAS domain-containing protein
MDDGSTRVLDLEHGERAYSFFVAPIIAARYANLYGRDITERKRAEEALSWSETQLRVILESTLDGILAVDTQGKVVKANRRFAELWRIPQPVLENRDHQTLLAFVLDQVSEP